MNIHVIIFDNIISHYLSIQIFYSLNLFVELKNQLYPIMHINFHIKVPTPKKICLSPLPLMFSLSWIRGKYLYIWYRSPSVKTLFGERLFRVNRMHNTFSSLTYEALDYFTHTENTYIYVYFLRNIITITIDDPVIKCELVLLKVKVGLNFIASNFLIKKKNRKNLTQLQDG